jgi:hypothetical protein
MPQETANDPRNRLVREKYFTLRPKPLERWLWQQGLPQAAERVFWLHWEEGQRSGDWCSEVPLKRVASLCCIDPSTVTRAYQLLKGLGLIRRESAGRDPDNPFHQATAITEVRIPRDLLVELSRSPNRNYTVKSTTESAGAGRPASPPVTKPSATSELPRPTRQQTQALWTKLSAAERSRYFNASRDGLTALEFDPDTQLTPEERGLLLMQLQQLADVRANTVPSSPTGPEPRKLYAGPRRLSALELARARKRVSETVGGAQAVDVLRQVVWAVEEGALRRFEMPLAVNIALKKIREGSWTRPNRMPPNWSRLIARVETCTAA